ncbi:uncharacterized protein LOC123899695 isoform X2 [Trifolium pratense]|uniref:uncharacterized protein LOC123899695 isoform X2 n=1 Tax=Trifolium pratense TaxID=57577 RepID=UPI001E693D00|nr:uncharacterized protein LOC123899695 isoform X2 [Trifolium pratense]
MPLIEIANAHSLRVSLPLPYYYYHQHHFKDSSTNKINWNYSFGNNNNFNVRRRHPRFPLLIKAVAAAPPLNPQPDLWEEEPPDEREKLRRSRISKANKGNIPWNKGRKHSLETLQKIKERTRIAMHNPKVKMKLTNRPAQTTETKLKIGARVKKLWEKRRGMKMVQETCFFEWQNLIAEASRQGLVGQEELQWNSYETLDEQLKQEWLMSLEERKQMTRPPLSNREGRLQKLLLQNGPIQ